MPATLLLADDSVTIQRVIELTFADEDVRVVVANDGEQAIRQLGNERIDIVLADVSMPRVDGYSVARFVKENSATRHIPVLLLTGAFEPIDEGKARATGCDGVLVKPLLPPVVIQRVKELLGGQHAAELWPSEMPRVARPLPVVSLPPAPPAPPVSAAPAETQDDTSPFVRADFDPVARPRVVVPSLLGSPPPLKKEPQVDFSDMRSVDDDMEFQPHRHSREEQPFVGPKDDRLNTALDALDDAFSRLEPTAHPGSLDAETASDFARDLRSLRDEPAGDVPQEVEERRQRFGDGPKHVFEDETPLVLENDSRAFGRDLSSRDEDRARQRTYREHSEHRDRVFDEQLKRGSSGFGDWDLPVSRRDGAPIDLEVEELPMPVRPAPPTTGMGAELHAFMAEGRTPPKPEPSPVRIAPVPVVVESRPVIETPASASAFVAAAPAPAPVVVVPPPVVASPVAPVVEPTAVAAVATPIAAEPVAPPAPVVVTPRAPLVLPATPIVSVPATQPTPVENVPAAGATPAPARPSLATAFSALLAAEKEHPAIAVSSLSATPLSEAAVEDVVRRVLNRMTNDAVHRVVLDTAERLIREEIARTKRE